jgi:hypothetical protein
MSFPINGRIAIIDDNINQARPLIEVLSSMQYPFTYYSGELKYLPSKEEFCNDIRVIFLDINLIDDSEHDEKTLRAKLVPVLSRIISPENYPYVIVYWSRHENHQKLIVDIFETDLNDRKPIGFLNENKLSYFNYDGTPAEEQEESVNQLFKKIDVLLKENPVFSYLLHWENIVHISADDTLEQIYSFTNSANFWEHEANYIFNKLGKSYSGKYFDRSSPPEKINSSFQALNSVFLDTLEYETNSKPAANPLELNPEIANHNAIISINKKLLLSIDTSELKYSGIVIRNNKADDKTEYSELINNLIFPSIKNYIYENSGFDPYTEIGIDQRKKLDALVKTELKQFKKGLLENYYPIILNVTPLCDFVQKKQKYDRLVKGFLIESVFKSNIDDKSEAIFISPDFLYNELSYFLVLDFKYFFTDNVTENEDYTPIFRIRQQVLSEVQSKLARHINRQGILFL